MSGHQGNFPHFQAFNSHVRNAGKGSIVIAYRNCRDYEGIVLAIMIVFDTENSKYDLDLQWMALGLDLYGDTLQESYVYRFHNLAKLLEYLDEKYSIKVIDMPVKFKFDHSRFPSPLEDKEKKPLYKTSWERFQEDFRNNALLDTALELVYDSNDH